MLHAGAERRRKEGSATTGGTSRSHPVHRVPRRRQMTTSKEPLPQPHRQGSSENVPHEPLLSLRSTVHSPRS